MVERVRIEDPNEQLQGNAPRARKALGGIQNVNIPRLDSGYKAGSGIGGAMAGLGAASNAFMQKQEDEAYISGQLAFMAGQTEDQVRAEGNEATMAGYVTMGVQNSVTQWQQGIHDEISTQHFSTDPVEFQKQLAAQTAGLLEKVGPDPIAREIFAKSMALSQSKLAAKQAAAYAEHNRQQTVSGYISSLINGGKAPQTIAAASATPTVNSKAGSYHDYAASLTERVIQIESSGNPNNANPDPDSTSSGLGGFTNRTWKETVRMFRPDLAKGKTDSELIALKTNATLARQMTTELIAYGAKDLARNGFPVNPTTSYLSHFLGRGGVKRFLRAGADTPVNKAVSKRSLDANKTIFLNKNGTYKTVGQIMVWAGKKMGTVKIEKPDPHAGHGHAPGEHKPSRMMRGSRGETVNLPVYQPMSSKAFRSAFMSGGAASRENTLKPEFQARYAALMRSAPKHIQEGLKIYSGNRTIEHQARLWKRALKKYGSAAAARKWVAPPGKSKHNHGIASDLEFNGVRLDKAPAAVRDWVHQNAPKHGLHFRMSWEPWHIETDPKFKGTIGGPSTIGAGTGASILMNPGLSPADHRMAVTSALVQSLNSDDDALYTTAGGVEALMSLGASYQQINAVRSAHEAYVERQQNAYNAQYESDLNDLMDRAREPDATEEEMREALRAFNEKYDLGDQAAKKLHRDVEAALDASGAKAAKNLLQEDPQLIEDMLEIRKAVIKEEIDADEAREEIEELGAMSGADRKSIATALKSVYSILEKREADIAKKAASEMDAVQRAKEKDLQIESMIRDKSLVTASSEQQKRGMEILRERLTKSIMEIVPEPDRDDALKDGMAKALINLNVPDRATAARMRASLLDPLDKNGKPNPAAKDAVDFYLRMKVTHKASDQYMAAMFKDDPSTLDYLRMVEDLHSGDSDLDGSMATAQKFRDTAVERKVYEENLKRVNTGELREQVKAEILDNTNRTDTWMNNIWNIFNSRFDETFISEEQRQMIMESSRFESAVESAIRTQTRLTPHASPESIRKRVIDQVGTAGRFVGGSFIMHQPGEKSLRERMGLNSSAEGIENTAVIAYLNEHGAEVFGEDVWADIGPGMVSGERPEIAVSLVGDMLQITPRSGMYAPTEGILGTSIGATNTSNPEARVEFIPARDIGKWYNEYELSDDEDLTNIFVDIAKPALRDTMTHTDQNSGSGKSVKDLLRAQGLIE